MPRRVRPWMAVQQQDRMVALPAVTYAERYRTNVDVLHREVFEHDGRVP